ncbi:hypothetical protein ONS96_012063 [Cadophora gregata f. sp. sojae]|nr:hypothetical protein ONS96_012063 [Cadophora gregata f. sp. sojae]
MRHIASIQPSLPARSERARIRDLLGSIKSLPLTSNQPRLAEVCVSIKEVIFSLRTYPELSPSNDQRPDLESQKCHTELPDADYTPAYPAIGQDLRRLSKPHPSPSHGLTILDDTLNHSNVSLFNPKPLSLIKRDEPRCI